MRFLARAVLTCIAAGFAVPVAAQTVEVVPFGGYRFGGSFAVSSEPGALEVKESATWGVSVGVKVAEDGELEASFARQDTRLASDGLFTSNPRFALAVEIYQVGSNYLFGEDRARLRPYIGAALGVTRLVPEPAELESETRFSASLAAGVKAYLGAHLCVRFEVRGFVTVLVSDSSVFCPQSGSCLVRTSGSKLSQAEVRGGLILRF